MGSMVNDLYDALATLIRDLTRDQIHWSFVKAPAESRIWRKTVGESIDLEEEITTIINDDIVER